MKILLNLGISNILFIISGFFALIGTLMILYADNHKVNTIVETPADILMPYIEKDYEVDPRIIYKRKFFDPHNKKMKRIKTLGIIILVIVPILTTWAILLPGM